MNPRKGWYWVALAVLPALCGCGGSRLVKATGRLMYQGKPVPSTRVTFQPDDGGRRSTGVTDDDGNFSLKYSRTEQGVARGRHTVFLTYEVSAEEEEHKIPPKADKALREVIRKYGDPKSSDLHYEVTRSGDHFDIELK
jgi:hypothetical protein